MKAIISTIMSDKKYKQMKKQRITERLLIFVSLLFILLFTACTNDAVNSTDNKDPELLKLVGKMSLEEKIGQMQQISGRYGNLNDELKGEIKQGNIGSILNEVNVKTRNEIQRIAIEESRLGIPVIFGRDVIHGFKTIFPIPLGQAASWNPELSKEGARIAAMESWASGVNWTFAPMMDISRDPRWGRIAESLGEDPFLASKFSEAMVIGFQGDNLKDDGTIIACAKHFAGYGAAEGGRDYNTTMIPEGEMRDVYLKPFHAAAKAGAASFMSGFNEINGIPATGNEFLLKKILREEWGFEGFVVSDWASVTEMIEHGFAADEKEAAAKAVKVGVDMEMASTSYKDHLKELITEGKIDEKLLDASVYRILKVKSDLGLFENPYIPEPDMDQFGKDAYLNAARKSAQQGFVLLKNENNRLPLSGSNPKIALIGPMAHQKYEQLGTWVFDADTSLSVTPLEGMQERFGENNIQFANGLKFTRDQGDQGFNAAIQAANNSDLAVICVGEESIISGEAHCLANLELTGAQNELIKAVAKTGKPIVLVILAGRPLAIGEISKYADAVIYGFHPGTMTGAALADIISGDVNPSGKLPVTFPKSAGQIPFYYNRKNTGRPSSAREWTALYEIPVKTPQTSLGNSSHYLDEGFQPLYAFGFGLSYTQFNYRDLKINTKEVSIGGDIEASVVLENTGNLAGEEISQLYIRDLVADVTRPIKELKAFSRTHLEPGESKILTFVFNSSELAFHNQKMENKVEPGDFELWIGGNSDANLKDVFKVKP